MNSTEAYEKAAEVLSDSTLEWEAKNAIAGNWIRLADSMSVNERHSTNV